VCLPAIVRARAVRQLVLHCSQENSHAHLIKHFTRGMKDMNIVTAQEVYLEALWRITPYGENLSGFAGLGR
jgi:hypothetical protein